MVVFLNLLSFSEDWDSPKVVAVDPTVMIKKVITKMLGLLSQRLKENGADMRLANH